MSSLNINYSLTFCEQVLLMLAGDAEQFVRNHARFASNWKLRSDKTLGFTGSDYRIIADSSSKKVIHVSRLSFLGLYSPLPWSFINDQRESEDHYYNDWIDLINKRFWELDFLAKTAQSDLRFLSLSKRNAGVMGGVIRLINSKRENINDLSVFYELKKFLGDFTICKIGPIPIASNIRISHNNLAYLSGGSRIGHQCALGKNARMRNGYKMTITLSEDNVLRENYAKLVESRDLLSLIFMSALSSKRIIPMQNQLKIRLKSNPQDMVLGGKSCALGRFSHIGKSQMLEVNVTV